MTRRAVAVGGIVLFLLVMGVILKGCVDSSHDNALKNYNQSVNELGTQSISNVTQALETLTSKDNSDALAQRQSLDQLATDSSKLTERARKLGSPSGLNGATWNLATALSLRATALSRISQLIGQARGTSKSAQETATGQIAGQMEALLASDALWQLRVTPFIKEAFSSRQISSASISSSTVLRDISWVNTATVANRIGGFSPSVDPTVVVAPGTHGHGLYSVTANGTTLNPGADAVTTVPAASGTSFVVTIENQGENNESDVTVSVTGVKRAGGARVFNQTKKVVQSLKGTKTPVTIPITKAASGAVTVTVAVKAVPGEKQTDNNKGTYNVIFQ